MRILATIKFTLKAMLIQWKVTVLVYGIFPLLLAMSAGYFEKDIFKPETNIDKINISILDEDNSSSSKDFKDLFNTKEFKQLFNLSDKGDYLITIPEGYEKALSNLQDVKITVEEKKRVSGNNELIIKNIINQYGKELTETLAISRKIETLDVRDKGELYDKVIGKLRELEAESVLKSNVLTAERTLTSYENQGASMITYVLFMIIMGCVASHQLDKENGSFKRIMSTPISKLGFFNLDLLIFFITSFTAGLIYIITFRITGLAFKDANPLIIASILIGQSLLAATLSGLMIAFFNKKNSNIILITVMYFQIIFGGVFIPVKEVTNEIFRLATRYAPGNIVSGAYKNCLLFNSFGKVMPYILSMVIVSMVIYAVSLIKVKIRWEE